MTSGVPGPNDDLASRGGEVVRSKTGLTPEVAIVLGSGLGRAFEGTLEAEAVFAFAELPGFVRTGVPGHVGELVLGTLAGVRAAVFKGRTHVYEGHGMDVPALTPRLAHVLGATSMVATAAVGGLVPGIDAGSLVILRDHVNLMGETPLRGWRHPDGTPAFVNTERVYDPELRVLAMSRAEELGIGATEGVYAAMSGPAYETPAEVAMCRTLGATVVGMSMVPETLPAHALGLRVLGLCSLTNAFGDHADHDEVVRVSNRTAENLGRLLVDLLPRLPGEGA